MKQLIVAIVACALSACGSQKPKPQETPQPEPQAQVKIDAPLVFVGTDGTQMGIPMVEATVRDGSALFIIDSGSTHNVLTRSYATKVRAPMLESRKISMSAGEEVDVLPVQGVVAFDFASGELREENVIALESPQSDAQGVGGHLAPHRVGEDNPVIIDFGSKSLKVVEGPDDKVNEWLEAQYPGLKDIGSYGDDGRPYATAKAGDNREVAVLIDTGNSQTRFEAAYMAVQGGQSSSPIVFAGFSFPLNAESAAMIDDDGQKTVIGAIGADVLQACTLMFWRSKDRIAIDCK